MYPETRQMPDEQNREVRWSVICTREAQIKVAFFAFVIDFQIAMQNRALATSWALEHKPASHGLTRVTYFEIFVHDFHIQLPLFDEHAIYIHYGACNKRYAYNRDYPGTSLSERLPTWAAMVSRLWRQFKLCDKLSLQV
jgi:hypothetical protein